MSPNRTYLIGRTYQSWIYVAAVPCHPGGRFIGGQRSRALAWCHSVRTTSSTPAQRSSQPQASTQARSRDGRATRVSPSPMTGMDTCFLRSTSKRRSNWERSASRLVLPSTSLDVRLGRLVLRPAARVELRLPTRQGIHNVRRTASGVVRSQHESTRTPPGALH
jgi:hypothetical protein